MVRAAILSNFVVQAFDIAAAINDDRRQGNPDHTLIRTRASDLDHDLDPSRAYFQVRQLRLDLDVRRELLLISALDQAPEGDLRITPIPCFVAALGMACKFARGVDGVLARRLDLRLNFSLDRDVELACELADGLHSDLELAIDLARELPHELYELDKARGQGPSTDLARGRVLNIDRSVNRVLSLAFERSHALNRVCALGVAGRLGLGSAVGLAQALLDGALDDFTTADLTHALLAEADLTGVRWSLAGTTWPPEIHVKTLLARSREAEPGVYVVTRRGMMWRPVLLARVRQPLRRRGSSCAMLR